MPRWELGEAPERIPVATKDFDKILDGVTEILYSFLCKSQGQWLDQIQQNSTVGGNNRARAMNSSAQNQRRRTV